MLRNMQNFSVQNSLLLLAILLAACAVRTSDLPVETDPPQPSTTPAFPTHQVLASPTLSSPTPPALVSPTPQAEAIPLPRYIITATLNYWQHHLLVDQKVLYTNRSPAALQDLLLIVEPASYAGTFKLNRLTYNGGQPFTKSTWEGSRLRLALPYALEPGEQIALEIAYELNLPAPVPSALSRPVPFGYTARQTNLVDWYPFVAPYIPEKGWLAHPAGYFGEHLAYETADFEVNIRIQGARENSGAPILLAASAPALVDGDWHRYRLSAARNFAFSASHAYQTATQEVGQVVVTSYFFSYHAIPGQAALQASAQAIELFSELFGPYPRQALSVVEADFLDGMEYEGLFFLSNGFYNSYQGTPADYLVAIAAHETAHQWWYALVGNDQALEPWLDEALCTYSERIFYERIHPEALDWWWAYRIDYYQPQGWVNGSIYNPQGYRAYRDAVYLNGAVFLEELRKLVGDQAFFDFLAAYATTQAGQLSTAADFFAILAEHSTADISGLLRTYFQPSPP